MVLGFHSVVRSQAAPLIPVIPAEAGIQGPGFPPLDLAFWSPLEPVLGPAERLRPRSVRAFSSPALGGPQAPHHHDTPLRTGLAGHFLGLDAPIFSGFRQFRIYILALGEQARRRPGRSKERLDRTGFSTGRAPARSRHAPVPHSFPQNSPPAPGAPWPATPVMRTASRRNAAFLPLLSTRWTRAPGSSRPARRQSAIPGKPPPDPKSTHTRASGASAMSCSESATCRVHTCAIVEGAIRLMRRLPLQQQRDESFEPLLRFT